MRVDVLIATRNRQPELALLLNSLRTQTFQDFDVVIVDESDDNILKFKPVNDVITRLKLEDHRVKLIKNNILKGIYHARNLAIKNAEHELLLRVDDDSICDRFYLEKLHAMFQSKCSPQTFGAVGGIVPPYSNPMSIRDVKFVSPVFNKITFHKDRVEIGDDGGYFYQPNKILYSDHLRSSFMFRKSVAEEIGLHTPCGGVIGWREETIFSMMMKWKGYKLLTDTSAICWHAHGSSGGARFPPEVYRAKQQYSEGWFQRWALRQYKKHGYKYG